MARYINPLDDLGGLLLTVEKPARYTGGEYGMLAKRDAAFQTVIAFPDLYEIGMSNQALRILYNRLNALPGVSCDRAFAPAPDFEALLRETGVPLYALDTGIALGDCDMLMFTLGYELGITSVLAMLEAAGIPHLREEREAGRARGDEIPVVIAGGPCVSNPLPYSRFIDAFWIGEAEDQFFTLAGQLGEAKAGGAGRAELLRLLADHPSVWTSGKKRAVRAVDARFSTRKESAPVFPVPSMRITQHHGIVEIMRGCPNGCRFCHAGIWYRPMRQKDGWAVLGEAADCVFKAGYREISLSSLSSGDYRNIEDLIGALNAKFGPARVSFQLPSLHVSTFSLPLLEKISRVRKSGLTFAVETPLADWQAALNKDISIDSVAAVMAQARKNGWRTAKLYFMIGLPAALWQDGGADEAEAIIGFVNELSARTGIKFSINAGVFVPKPHTPFQWCAQVAEERAREALRRIRDALKKRGHKVSVHDPFTALVEGVIARGDEEVGLLIEEAYRAGCRLDAWSEHFREDIWRDVLGRHDAGRITGAREVGPALAWDMILSGVSAKHLEREYEKAREYRTGGVCAPDCADRCGVCLPATERGDALVIPNARARVQAQPAGWESSGRQRAGDALNIPEARARVQAQPAGVCLPATERGDALVIPNARVRVQAQPAGWESSGRQRAGDALVIPNARARVQAQPAGAERRRDPDTYRILFSFSKEGRAVFLSHLALVEVFSMAFLRAGIPVLYTAGFNPLPRLDFAAPLSLGIAARAEIASVDTEHPFSADDFMRRLNGVLPEGIAVIRAAACVIPSGQKKHSVASLLWGFEYEAACGERDYVAEPDEKAYREARYGDSRSVYGLHRTGVLAKSGDAHDSYFDVYASLYGQ